MKNKMKRVLLTAVAALLLMAVSVGGTLAYLQSISATVTNTFTVGNVTITLDEAKVTVYGEQDGNSRVTENTYKLLPGHNYLKDPTIHVAEGSEKCHLFVKVVDQIADIQADTTIADQMVANGWTLIDTTNGIWHYNETVDAREEAKDVDVFGEFTLKTDADVTAYANKTITVKAYAIQADGFENSEVAEIWAAVQQ